GFGMRGSARLPPQRSISNTSLSAASNPMSRRLTSLATSRSIPLASSLTRALATTSLVSAAEPADEGGRRPRGHFGQDVGIGREVERQVALALDLLLGRPPDTVVGHG